MGKEIRRIYEDWLDDLGLDLKNQQSASRKVMNGVDNDYVKHQFSEYSHTLKIDLRVSGISDDKRDELILPLKKWFDFLDDMLESFQLFDQFYIAKMRIEDANHSGHHKKNVPGFVDNFSEDFEAPFPDEFNLSEFYQSKGHTVYNMIPYIYIDVWFNPCEKMPFNRFMNQYYRWSTAIYRYFSNAKDMDVSMYFSFYNNEVPKYSISTFEMHDGQVKGLTKPLKRIYHSLYGEDANVDDNNDVLAHRVMIRTTERMDVYIQKMIAYGRLKHHINVTFVDRFEQQISDYETLKRWGYNAGQPESSKILAFRVEATDEKEVKMPVVEDTVISGFFCQLPTNAVKMFQFMFIMQIMQKFVDDAEQERQKKLADKNITWTERNELKRGRNYYGTGLGSAYTEAAEAYNDENSKRKQYWRIRQGRINSSGKEFAILCVDKNGKICRADNTSLGIYGDLRNLWNKACAMIEDMKE